MYEVIDSQTGERRGLYQTFKRASRRADRLDLIYGAIRYAVRRIEVKPAGTRSESGNNTINQEGRS